MTEQRLPCIAPRLRRREGAGRAKSSRPELDPRTFRWCRSRSHPPRRLATRRSPARQARYPAEASQGSRDHWPLPIGPPPTSQRDWNGSRHRVTLPSLGSPCTRQPATTVRRHVRSWQASVAALAVVLLCGVEGVLPRLDTKPKKSSAMSRQMLEAISVPSLLGSVTGDGPPNEEGHRDPEPPHAFLV